LLTLQIARFGRDLVVVFGATEFVAPIRLRLFHAGGNRFAAVAYRISPNPDGGETWTPDAFCEADLRDALEHIPSFRIVGAGRPTPVEVGDADLAMLVARAKPPRARPLPWLQRLAPADTRAAADASPGERPAKATDLTTSSHPTPGSTTPPSTATGD
jgi:hypothetical protein